jgi:hypothetical protein
MITATVGPRRQVWSTELRVAIAPARTYAGLLSSSAPMTWADALVRPATTLLVIAIAIPVLAVQRVTVPLVVLTAVAWCFVPLLQLLGGAALIASAPRGRVAMPRAMDLWFAASLPYNLWMLAAAFFVAVSGWSGSMVWLLTSALPALIWTAALAWSYCRVVLDLSPASAAWRVIAYELGSLAAVLGYQAWAAGGWFNVVGSIADAVR